MLAAALFALSLFTSPAMADDVTLKAEDGTKLHAVYTPAAKPKSGVVLVHMLGRDSGDWRFVADKLKAQGISSVAVDLRAHGANAEEGQKPSDADFSAMHQDVAAAVAHLRAQGLEDVQLVGASIGANLVLKVAAKDPEIRSVVLLSPGMEYKGVSLDGLLEDYGERPLLVVVSRDDRYSAKTGLWVESQARGYTELEIYEAAGHGTRMLNKAPSLEPMLISWLLGSYRLKDAGTGKASLQVGDQTDVETTGQTLDER